MYLLNIKIIPEVHDRQCRHSRQCR